MRPSSHSPSTSHRFQPLRRLDHCNTPVIASGCPGCGAGQSRALTSTEGSLPLTVPVQISHDGLGSSGGGRGACSTRLPCASAEDEASTSRRQEERVTWQRL